MRRSRFVPVVSALFCGVLIVASGPTVAGPIGATPPPGDRIEAAGAGAQGTAAALVAVPDVVGLTETSAIAVLIAAGLQPGSRVERDSDDLPAGSILASEPAAGTTVEPGTFVDYVVARGAEREPTPQPTGTATEMPVPMEAPTPASTTLPDAESTSLSRWDRFKDHLKTYLEVVTPSRIADWVEALNEPDSTDASAWAGEIRRASLELLAWLDGEPPHPCYADAWQALHALAAHVVASVDLFAAGDIAAANEELHAAGRSMTDTGMTIQDAGEACRASIGSPGCDDVLTDALHLSDPSGWFTIDVPWNWRSLAKGDPGWLVIASSHRTKVEADVADGSTRLFVVPLEPRDADPLVTLKATVGQLAAGTTLEQAGDIVEGFLVSVSTPHTIIAREVIGLPAGPAIRITTSRSSDIQPEGVDERRVWYLMVQGDWLYQLDFRSDAATAELYAVQFQCIAETLQPMTDDR